MAMRNHAVRRIAATGKNRYGRSGGGECSRPFKRAPGTLEEDPLLQIEHTGRGGGDSEVSCIECMWLGNGRASWDEGGVLDEFFGYARASQFLGVKHPNATTTCTKVIPKSSDIGGA